MPCLTTSQSMVEWLGVIETFSLAIIRHGRMANSRYRKFWLGLLGVACISSLILGFSLLCKLLPPERIIVTGKVTDGVGKLLIGVEIHAVPVPVLVQDEPPREVYDHRKVKTFTNKDGSYRLKGLAGRCGWKESSYIQPYHFTFELAGYKRKLIDFQKSGSSKESVISGLNIVLEEETTNAGRKL